MAGGIGLTAVTGGISVSITKGYRTQLWIGWALFMLGMGILITLDSTSPLSHGVCFPIIAGAGCGVMASVCYFPVLSPLDITQNARALAFFAFCRSFAAVWGVSIGGAVLQNELKRRLPAQFLADLPSGSDFTYGIIPEIRGLPAPLKGEVQLAFAGSMSVVWKVMTGIVAIGLFVSLFMSDVPLSEKVDEKWGIEKEQPAINAGDPVA